MVRYRNPHAAVYIGKLISEHLGKSQLSQQQLAKRLGISDAKLLNLLLGQHYFPLELAETVSNLLDIEAGELVRNILLQDFPKHEVEFAFQAIGAYAISRHKHVEEKPNGSLDGKKKRKNKKARRGDWPKAKQGKKHA